MKAMETLQDLIEEAKARTVWWCLCIFAFAYFLSHTSKSLWMNIPIAILLVSALRILAKEVDFRWKQRPESRPMSYLSYLEKKQLSLNDPRLSTVPPTPKWRRKVDSPLVEDAVNEFVSKILKDFVVDLWYTDITPDKEAPELIGAVITDAIGEICGRVKQLNLVDLLTREVVDLVGDHIDLFRRNQAAIGVDVMGTLSIEERDERLKHHLMASKELHPALISPECEYKVLQRLIEGVLAVVLRPREAQSPLVRCIARELVTCLVMQPVMNFVSPAYINELIECILLAVKDDGTTNVTGSQPIVADYPSIGSDVQGGESTARKYASPKNIGTDMTLAKFDAQREMSSSSALLENTMQSRPAEWVRVMEAATQRRTEILTPENLENMWTKGRNYKNKAHKKAIIGFHEPTAKSLKSNSAVPGRDMTKDVVSDKPGRFSGKDDKALVPKPGLGPNTQTQHPLYNRQFPQEVNKAPTIESVALDGESDDSNSHDYSPNKNRLKRSNSTSTLNTEAYTKKTFTIEGQVPVLSEDFYSPDPGRRNDKYMVKSSDNVVYRIEGLHLPKLMCRVIGAYFEKVGSKSFAVYSIAVTGAENTTWFVKRRYRNFERLHRQLKDIPNYTLHLPPKRIFSSSTEDSFVRRRCIQLDKYLQDLLSIANVAEQHEVWDFLSVSSKNYAFGKSPSVMRTLAVNVDEAVDDMVRQFKGVSDGLLRIVASPSLPNEATVPLILGGNMSWNADEMRKQISLNSTAESTNSFSDNEEGEQDGTHGHEEIESVSKADGWHSDNELTTKAFPPRVIKLNEDFKSSASDRKLGADVKFDMMDPNRNQAESFPAASGGIGDPTGMPPGWTPPNVSVPILNLVDKIFQLKRRGWLRRQVLWISKQILQLMMEDAIDDWLIRQIHWLRRENIVAEGIKWVQDVLWPDGVFFLPLSTTRSDVNGTKHDEKIYGTASQSGSKASKAGRFEEQLEAARRASNIKKMLFEGAPPALVSLIGSKQYKRCAKDIYYFSQSTICVKQLGYGVLELVLISVFPELRDVVIDMHKQMRGKVL